MTVSHAVFAGFALCLACSLCPTSGFLQSSGHIRPGIPSPNLRIATCLSRPKETARPGIKMISSALSGQMQAPIVVEPVVQSDVKAIREVATFFVGSFWKDYKAQAELTADQLRRLGNEQYEDMRQRYGINSAVPSSLIVARNGVKGEIIGCVGVEMALVHNEKILPKSKENLQANYDLRPLLANLAVSPIARRRGLARDLCKASEALVKSWGSDELLLLVEDGNEPARRLYKKLGFKDIWRDETAKASMAVPFGSTVALQVVKVTNVAMRKELQTPPGLFGLGFMGL